jgi:carboxypeptidase Taq
MTSHYQALKTHLGIIGDLQATLALLAWDQETQMPPGAAEARARQMSTVSRLQHDMFTSDKTAALLEKAAQDLQGAEYASDEPV